MNKAKSERPQVNESFALLMINSNTHTHIHTHTYIYIYIYIYTLHELFLYSFISDESFESILEIGREKNEGAERTVGNNFLCSKVKANKDGNRQKEQINC